MRFEDGYGVNRAATTPAADLCPGAAAGAVRGAGPDAEVRLEEAAGAQGEATCAAAQDDDHHHHNDNDGTKAVNRRSDV